MNDETFKIYGYIISSSYRTNVLKELKNKGLVDIINPEAKKGRYYRLTKMGEEIAEELN